MTVDSSRINAFFEPLVGTPDLREEFKLRVTQHAAIDRLLGADPWRSLENAAYTVVSDKLSRQMLNDPMLETNVGEWGRIKVNFPVGISNTVLVLGYMGTVYTDRAKVPQKRTTVVESVRNITRHVHRMAFLDKAAGSTAMIAFLLGIDPQTPNLESKYNTPSSRLEAAGPTGSLKVTHAVDDQIHIGIRYPLLPRPSSEGMCPAATARVEGGKQGPYAIRTMLNLIGDVGYRQYLRGTISNRHGVVVARE